MRPARTRQNRRQCHTGVYAGRDHLLRRAGYRGELAQFVGCLVVMADPIQSGLMFWFIRKRLPGS